MKYGTDKLLKVKCEDSANINSRILEIFKISEQKVNFPRIVKEN